MESHKYLTGRWLNGRKITVAVSACLLTAAVVKITNLAIGADSIINNSSSSERPSASFNISTKRGVECIVGQEDDTSQERRRLQGNFSATKTFPEPLCIIDCQPKLDPFSPKVPLKSQFTSPICSFFIFFNELS